MGLFTARLSRLDTNANVLAMGARVVALELPDEILRVWLEPGFDGGRHLHRIEQISEIEHTDLSARPNLSDRPHNQ